MTGFRVQPGIPVRYFRKEINASGVSSVMKQGRKKAGHDEPDAQVHDGHVAGGETRDTPGGIDAIRVIQLVTCGVALIILIWFVLHSVLNMI